MGFKYTHLCDLLDNLENGRASSGSTAARKANPDIQAVAQWFTRHERAVHDLETDRVAFLSCMFPEKRTDRVYWLGANLLSRVIGRCLGLGTSRLQELNRWQSAGNADLGKCVEIVMSQAENDVSPEQELLVEEIDRAMETIASRCRFSGPQVRQNRSEVDCDSILSSLYRRSSSRDAKWLTRMILKSYAPIVFPEKFTLKKFHFLLPHLFLLQNSFDGALEMLASEPINHFPPNPDPQSAKSLSSIAMQHLRPRVGIKVGRPDYYKARSIKHCHQMVNGRRMSIERKYDGEYCQIHVDMSNKFAPIQIFSKSGKDSTADRDKVIPVIEEALGLGSSDCKISGRCILEGELLVWNDEDGEIMDFNKLRRLLPRSGILLGVENDSPPQPFEHLMIMFFDILMLDDDICLSKPHRERRLLLQKVVRRISGRSDLAHQEVLDFSRDDSYHRLGRSFEKAITQRWEGYVLKASDEPYFPIYSTGVDQMFGRWIKLKKDYIPGLGDTVDLAIIGANYNSRDVQSLSQIRKLKWTHFFVGCLLNKEELQDGSLPHFRVVDVIGRHSMSLQNMQLLNQFGEFYECSSDSFEGFAVEYGHNGLSKATTWFKQPFVVEMLGSGFEKPPGGRYFSLRFPRILKVHLDRTMEDTASFRELQILAEDARALPLDEVEELKDRVEWSKRLGLGSELTQSTETASDPEATCSDTDSESPSPVSQIPFAPTASEYSYMEARPLMDCVLDEKPTKNTLGQSLASHPRVPSIYTDVDALPIEPENPVCESSVLVNNINLAFHQNSTQSDEQRASLHSDKPARTNLLQDPAKAKSTVAGPPSPTHSTSLFPVRKILSKDSQQRQPGGSRIESSFPSLKRKGSPQSPLTTIPLWTPETSFGSFTLPETDQNHYQDINSNNLQGFVQRLRSNATAFALQQSNPHAASQGTKYGIVLFDPKMTALGEEMRRVVVVLSTLAHSGRDSVAPVGKIFFLGSGMLTRDIRPDDCRFCLRETWEKIGSDHYYGGIRWDLRGRPGTLVADKVKHTSTSNPKLVGDQCSQARTEPWINITFNDFEIAVLGEYTSIEPPTHVEDV
ncbi:unnamed protein product [Penicillium salamii]|uniref:ATP-dependent DNA ligase family profile domain-containing protein n=1 Tax=Penicillium salamii TaxID=1612424 RepID=A0A9W4NSU3_9EURO|nr:unnamed protein product [Penicillium salamii]